MDKLLENTLETRRERVVRTHVYTQQFYVALLATALTEADKKLDVLTFPLGFPVPGHTSETLRQLLRSIIPDETIDTWTEQARAMVINRV